MSPEEAYAQALRAVRMPPTEEERKSLQDMNRGRDTDGDKGGATTAAMAPLDVLAGALKGSVAATLGLPGDVESLVRMLTGGEQRMPTTEDVSAALPKVVEGDAGREHSAKVGEMAGEFLPVAPVAAAAKMLKISTGKLAAALGAAGLAVAPGAAGSGEDEKLPRRGKGVRDVVPPKKPDGEDKEPAKPVDAMTVRG